MPAVSARPSRGPLSAADASRALYLDFEGNKDKMPTLLGVLATATPSSALDDGVYSGTILEPAFYRCARRHGPRRVLPGSLAEVVAALVDRCKREERVLVAWSEHDLALIEKSGEVCVEHKEAVRHLYRNAKETAKRWLRRVDPALLPQQHGQQHRLSYYLDVIGYRVPERFGPGLVGENLREIRTRLAAVDGNSGTLGPEMRARWKRVVRHNEYDCRGLRALVLYATGALEL